MKSLALREKLAAKAREVNKEEASNGKVDGAEIIGNYWKTILTETRGSVPKLPYLVSRFFGS